MQTSYVTLLLLQHGHRSEDHSVEEYNAIMKVGHFTQTLGIMLDVEQMFDNDSVFGAKISQTIIETPLEHRFVWAHWRQNHAFVAVSTLDTIYS